MAAEPLTSRTRPGLKVGTRIYALAGLLLATMAAVGGAGVVSLEKGAARLEEYARVATNTTDVLQASLDFARARRRLSTFALSGQPDDAAFIIANVKHARETYSQVRAKTVDPDRVRMLTEIATGMEALQTSLETLIDQRKAAAQAVVALNAAWTRLDAQAITPDAPAIVGRYRGRLGNLVNYAVLSLETQSAQVRQDYAHALADLDALTREANTSSAGGQAVHDGEPVRQRAADVMAASAAFQTTLTGSVEKTAFATLDVTTKLIAAFQQRAASVRVEADTAVTRAESVVTVIVLAAILAGLALSFVIARGIVAPLKSMTGAMNRLAGGNADIEVTGQDRGDEIGDMARALDVFRQNADKIVAMMKAETVTREIGDIIAGAAAGDLTRRVDLSDKSGFLRDIGAQVNTLLETSNDAMRDFGVKAAQTAASVNEASVAVGQVSDGARSQMTSLTQVAAALTDSAAAIKMVSEGTQNASAKAAASSVIVQKALTAVEQLVVVVETIGQNSRKINQITQVIAQIANRTHILSLNAAIEAARAGEHGKGFVVVAPEVGKLAESAAQNARQITEIVEQANQDAQEGRAATGEVRNAMQSVATGTTETTDIIRSVSVAMEEQRASIAQIDSRVTDLRSIAASNSAASEEIAATMLQLAELATDTRERIARFRTT